MAICPTRGIQSHAKRIAGSSILLGILALLSGCILREGPRVEREEVREEVVGDPVEVEPPPAQRVYVYERGYPPGTYFYDGYYYYGHQRYERNVFITKVVNVNIEKNRYVNVTENRRIGPQVEQKHQQEYANNGGGARQRYPQAKPSSPHSSGTEARRPKKGGKPTSDGSVPDPTGITRPPTTGRVKDPTDLSRKKDEQPNY